MFILQKTQYIVYIVYKNRPKTSLRAYRQAQKALQVEEEQTFNEEEAEQLLPRSLRNRYPRSKH